LERSQRVHGLFNSSTLQLFNFPTGADFCEMTAKRETDVSVEYCAQEVWVKGSPV